MDLHKFSTEGMQFDTLKGTEKVNKEEEGVKDKEEYISDSPLVEHIAKSKLSFNVEVY
jgi:hypothetical protein